MVMLNSNLRGMHAPKPKLSKWAYTGVVRPKLLYACMTWGNSINTVYQLKKLKALDRLATRSTTTIKRNTPQASIEIMIDLMPIELMIQKSGISAYIRLKKQLATPFQTQGKMTTPHLQYWENLICDYNIKTPITDSCSERVWEKTYNVNMESLKGGKKHLRHSEYTIYTDGSKKEEGTGGGFVIYHYKKPIYTHSFKLMNHATVYQAELEAIYQACKYMDDNYDTIKPKYVKILTDSQAALKSLDSIDFKSTMALKTAEALENLKWRTKGCTIAWIKAHIGTEGNEAADEAAKKGAENIGNKFQLIRTPIPQAIRKEDIDKAIRQEWKRKWQVAPQYKHTKHFYSGPDKNKAKKILNISRSHLTRLISIITGFNCLSYIQFKANPTINPLCRLCGEENETFWHFVTNCPRLYTYRNDIFMDKPPQQDNWQLKQIMQFSTYPTIYNLMSYNQEYNEQPIYELDLQYSEDSESDTTILQNLYRSYL